MLSSDVYLLSFLYPTVKGNDLKVMEITSKWHVHCNFYYLYITASYPNLCDYHNLLNVSTMGLLRQIMVFVKTVKGICYRSYRNLHSVAVFLAFLALSVNMRICIRKIYSGCSPRLN